MADGGRRSLGGVATLGLAGAGLAAVAGHEAWAAARDCQLAAVGREADSPATTALALALLAAWGVLLVTRGRVRRAVSWLAALLALGLVPTVVVGRGAARDVFRNQAEGLSAADCTGVHTTGWFWVAAVATLVAAVAAVAAAVLVPRWPEMGRRYDAPAAGAPDAADATAQEPPEERENLDLWKAISEGRDPTD